MKRQVLLVLATAAVVVAAGTVRSEDEDLTLVRKAVQVAQASPQETAPAPEPEVRRVEPRKRKTQKEPNWLRVRIVEKGEKKSKVSINVPFFLAETLADKIDEETDGECGLDWPAILKALKNGQDLVEIEDATSSVRIYVE